jgi:hypothetical protein
MFEDVGFLGLGPLAGNRGEAVEIFLVNHIRRSGEVPTQQDVCKGEAVRPWARWLSYDLGLFASGRQLIIG